MVGNVFLNVQSYVALFPCSMRIGDLYVCVEQLRFMDDSLIECSAILENNYQAVFSWILIHIM